MHQIPFILSCAPRVLSRRARSPSTSPADASRGRSDRKLSQKLLFPVAFDGQRLHTSKAPWEALVLDALCALNVSKTTNRSGKESFVFFLTFQSDKSRCVPSVTVMTTLTVGWKQHLC